MSFSACVVLNESSRGSSLNTVTTSSNLDPDIVCLHLHESPTKAKAIAYLHPLSGSLRLSYLTDLRLS